MAEKTITMQSTITVGDLADKLDIPPVQLIGELFKNGIAATINQKIDIETAQIIVEELGLSVEIKAVQKDVVIDKDKTDVTGADVKYRPPIVAVMGHVDHGKTSLLDAVLQFDVAKQEAGGITQHISAYQVEHTDRLITLLDTPGHEAFSALRQHGAYLTDVVVIVVAADDGVKPQTIEAINFARTAKAHIVVAINKIDKTGADIDRAKSELSAHGLIDEKWTGGNTVMVPVSAKTKEGVNELLDMILLVADIDDLKADYDRPAEGLVIEAHQEQGRGVTTNILIAHGELKTGQYLVAGSAYGKVRTLRSWEGKPIKLAGPATPVEITGLKNLPEFGQQFRVVKNEKEARSIIADSRQGQSERSNVSSQEVLRMISRKHDTESVPAIVKADVQGSLTSVVGSLKLLETNEVKLHIVGSSVGDISENDVKTAASSKAVIYGFNVNISTAVSRLAKQQGVSIRIYKIIYELIDDAKQLMSEFLKPEIIETEVGKLTIKGIFRTTKDLVVCGGEVTSGKATANVLARVIRGKEQIAEVEVSSVQRQQQEAKEVFEGELCGLQLKTKSKLTIEEGDKLEFFTREVKQRQLD